jgi:hypothetical protein
LVPVIFVVPGPLGFLVVGLLCALALGPVLRFVTTRLAPAVRHRVTSRRAQ